MSVVKERPIIFSAPMVRAILEGRKTQTRRVVKPQTLSCGPGAEWWDHASGGLPKRPHGRVGDRLWVREDWDCWANVGRGRGWTPPQGVWRSPIFMPRERSRILLEITNERIERLQEISEADAIAEGAETHAAHYGLPPLKCWGSVPWHRYDGEPSCAASAVESYSTLWDSINAKRHPWSSNPWVWVLEFRRLESEK